MEKLQDNFAVDNYKNKNSLLIKFSVLFVFLFIPTITYLVILNINPSLKYYFANLNVVENNFGKNVIAHKWEIEIFAWLSLSFLIIGLIMTFFLILFLKSKVNSLYKLIYIIFIASFSVIAIVFIAISEYSYSKFYNLFEFLSQDENADLFKNEDIKNMQDVFMDMYKGENGNSYKYKWSTDTLTWWLAIFKIIAVILCFNVWLKHNKTKIFTIENTYGNINRSITKDFLNKFSLNTRKNIQFWLIIATTLVFITPLIYIINMSLLSSKMNSMLNWTFIIPDLYKSVSTDSVINIEGSYFSIKFLPIIVSGFLISNILISSIAYIQNWKSSKKTFAVEFAILLVEILSILIIIAYSTHEVQRLTNLWNKELIQINPNAYESKYLESVYGSWYSPQSIYPSPWMSGLKYISQTVISLSFLATIYIILGVRFKKIKEK
ncbi:hypothetical protein [Spiroplasma floricola]|uniref:Uncharacterized protein n=1 Tax=Spiroplasma floricola 23-6 TaxID=1336749 RepID=A0A2K8SFV4_9MOLU|nr:hypothetical protein [Spiroplasma floricola]AUB32138.1 hypothetical protein SFLOR_v1c10920 [Spiroplasma floricola 23-6]